MKLHTFASLPQAEIRRPTVAQPAATGSVFAGWGPRLRA